MSFFLLARWIHIAAGAVAFITFWLPLVARKGGTLHRRVGWVYVGAMLTVAPTALVMSGWRFVESPRQQPLALFFTYLGVMAAANASMGVRVLRAKTRTGAHRSLLDLGLSALVLLMGLLTGAWGLALGEPLLWGFAPVGIVTGTTGLVYWLRAPRERMHWWFQHMGAMVASGIGTLTAFLVANAKHFGVNGAQLALFLGPTVVGVTGLKLWERYYRRRFTPKGAPAARESAPLEARLNPDAKRAV